MTRYWRGVFYQKHSFQPASLLGSAQKIPCFPTFFIFSKIIPPWIMVVSWICTYNLLNGVLSLVLWSLSIFKLWGNTILQIIWAFRELGCVWLLNKWLGPLFLFRGESEGFTCSLALLPIIVSCCASSVCIVNPFLGFSSEPAFLWLIRYCQCRSSARHYLNLKLFRSSQGHEYRSYRFKL